MDPSEKFERLIDEAQAAAREEPKPGTLASAPCQMMLPAGAPGSRAERPCGVTPTVGVCGLRRYCAQHLEIVARTCVVLRDADADLQIDGNGDLVATPANFDALRSPVTLSVTGTKSGIFAAPQPGQKVIRCESVWAATPAARIVEAPPDIAAGDYIRIDWTVPDYRNGDWSRHGLSWSEKPVWVEGEVMRVHRAKLDLVAEIRVDRSNWIQAGLVAGIGIGQGARRIPRPGRVVAVDPPTPTTAGFTSGGSYVVGQTVSTPTGKFQCTASGSADGPAPVFGVLATLPTEIMHPETAPYLKTLRDRSASDEERLSARQWLRLNGYDLIAGVKSECDRVFDEIQLARLERADALPVGKAPMPTEHLARIKALLADGTLSPGEARAALSRMIYKDYSLKHGPGGSGWSGPCDASCVKCAAEEEIERTFAGGAPMPDADSDLVAAMAAVGQEGAFLEWRGHPTPPDDTTFNSWPPVGSAQPNPERETWPSDASVAELRKRLEPPRPDGFSQAQVDAAKAVLLAPAAKRGGKR